MQIANDLVAVCGDADCFAGVDKGADHPCADIGLARARRPLNGKYAAIDRRREAQGRVERRLSWLLKRLAANSRPRPHKQVAGGKVRPIALHSLVRDMLANAHERIRQDIGADDLVRKHRLGMNISRVTCAS